MPAAWTMPSLALALIDLRVPFGQESAYKSGNLTVQAAPTTGADIHHLFIAE